MVHRAARAVRLATRVVELESDRGVVVDTAAADLRRIERDLHDGAQARLVALAMDLGLAKEKLRRTREAAARMVDEAHGEVKTALQELRDLARGIHPAVLTDRGLDAALSAVASRCTVPVRVEVDLPARPAPAIEGIAYFTVSELLQNVSKHARARRPRGCVAGREPADAPGQRRRRGRRCRTPPAGRGTVSRGSRSGWTRWTASWSWTRRPVGRPGSRRSCPGGADRTGPPPPSLRLNPRRSASARARSAPASPNAGMLEPCTGADGS